MTVLASARPALACFLASGALVAASLTASPVASASAALAPAPGPAPVAADTATFQATVPSVGAIPDGPDTGGTCSTTTPAVKEVLIPVSGIRGPINSVKVQLAIEHDKLGDLGFQLVAPDGTAVGFIDRIGAARVGCGDDTGLNGTFTFYDGAPGNLLASATALDATRDLTGGAYFPSTAGGSPVPLSAPFAGAGDGTWKLRILDYQAGVTGRVYGASLSLGYVDAVKLCARATRYLKAQKSSRREISADISSLQSRFRRAKKSDAGKNEIANFRRKLGQKKRHLVDVENRIVVYKSQRDTYCG